jgi:hypothetical protein
MQPDAIYLDFIQCEDGFANLYLEMSVRFWDHSELSWFWIEMAMREKQRAGLLHHCLEKRVFAREMPNPVTLQLLARRLEELARRATEPGLTVDEAFDIAVQIETSEIEAIRAGLIQPIDGPFHILNKKREICESYTPRLREAARNFAVSPSVQSKIASFC